jgi:hypothetical protein
LSQTADAREALDAADTRSTQLEASKLKSSKTPQTFTAWQTESAANETEKSRLRYLIPLIEDELQVAEASVAEAELREKYEAKHVANAELAKRIQSEVAKANAIILAVVAETAQSALEDQVINAQLPEHLERFISADFQARARSGLPRQEIGRERVWLWTKSENQALIGDQASVRDLGEGRGIIEHGPEFPITPTRCRKMLSDEITYHPVEAIEQRIVPIWSLVLPMPDGPGMIFDGTKLIYASEVAAALDWAQRLNEPRERPIRTEIQPIGIVWEKKVEAAE